VESIDSLARRLARLELIEAARLCVTRYVNACDRRDHEALAREVFVEDAVLHVPGADFRGREAVVAFFREAFTASPRLQRHFLASPVTEVVDAGTVASSCCFLYVGSDADVILGCGSYRDVMVVQDGVARMREKTITMDLMQPIARAPGPAQS